MPIQIKPTRLRRSTKCKFSYCLGCGIGCFNSERLPENALIGRYTGEIIKEQDFVGPVQVSN